jgi:hypothetical protein
MAEVNEAKLERSAGKATKAHRKEADAPNGKATGRASRKKGGQGSALQVVKTSRKAKQEKAAGKASEEGLGSAASKAVGRNKENLAKHLLSETLHGRAQSAKLLLSLAEAKTGRKDEEKDPPRRSLALLLESEPEWRGKRTEGAANAGGKNLEPIG